MAVRTPRGGGSFSFAASPPLTARGYHSPRTSSPNPPSLAALAARRSVSHDSYGQAVSSPLDQGSVLRSPRSRQKPSSPSVASVASGTSRGTEDATTASEGGRRLSSFSADRAKKSAEDCAQSIENRIRYFQLQEERIWRDIEEVRRQAHIRENGKARAAEKKVAARAIQHGRDAQFEEKRSRANQTRKMLDESAHRRDENERRTTQERLLAFQDQRRMSGEILRQKRLGEKQAALRNTQRVVEVQRSQLEARIKTAQLKSEKIQMLREQAERHRAEKEQSVHDVESRLPTLEAEEMVCIQRLQHSRIVSQSVLQELETAFEPRSSIAAVLRARSSIASLNRPMGILDEAHETRGEEGDCMAFHSAHDAVYEEVNGVSGNCEEFFRDGSQ